MRNAALPLLEIDRFFAAPQSGTSPASDAQSAAIERLVLRCEQVRPHLHSAAALERFIAKQHDPARIRRRISLALALERAHSELVYGHIGLCELETFRALAQRRLAAIVWVFA